MANLIKSTVLENNKLNAKFHHLRLKVDNPEFRFLPGQFVTVKVAPLTFRSYSIASLPDTLPLWDLFVDITPQGPGTKYIEKLQPGEIIETTQPVGNFILNNPSSSHIILGATGCGMASIRPMIEQLLQQKSAAKIYLFWGLRYIKDIVWKEKLEEWRNNYPNFSYQICLSRPEGPWSGKTGHITATLLETAKALPSSEISVYLCGSAEMITDVRGQLHASKFPEERIYFESY